jgi:hypothetical protein
MSIASAWLPNLRLIRSKLRSCAETTAIQAARLPFSTMLSLPHETVRNRILHETDLQNKNVIKHSAIYIANYILQRGMPQPLVRCCFDSVSASSNFCYWIPPATRHSTKTELCNLTLNPQSSCSVQLPLLYMSCWSLETLHAYRWLTRSVSDLLTR